MCEGAIKMSLRDNDKMCIWFGAQVFQGHLIIPCHPEVKENRQTEKQKIDKNRAMHRERKDENSSKTHFPPFVWQAIVESQNIWAPAARKTRCCCDLIWCTPGPYACCEVKALFKWVECENRKSLKGK